MRADNSERERLAILNALPAKNPPELMRQVRVRVVKPFGVAGRRVEAGEVMELARHDAASMVALGKAEIL